MSHIETRQVEHEHAKAMTCRSAITDYFPKWRVPKTRRLLDWLNVLMVFVVGWGWYEFETHDVGLTGLVQRIWKADKEKR